MDAYLDRELSVFNQLADALLARLSRPEQPSGEEAADQLILAAQLTKRYTDARNYCYSSRFEGDLKDLLAHCPSEAIDAKIAIWEMGWRVTHLRASAEANFKIYCPDSVFDFNIAPSGDCPSPLTLELHASFTRLNDSMMAIKAALQTLDTAPLAEIEAIYQKVRDCVHAEDKMLKLLRQYRQKSGLREGESDISYMRRFILPQAYWIKASFIRTLTAQLNAKIVLRQFTGEKP